ncbi:MAG: LysR family transcriptional regulator [Rhodocyclales bacterium]|nr:LysR family transcriptional regulator [Rhodocyclales bacterium]
MNISEFDLNLLVVFEAVLADGSISRAAERLNLSQPAVSNALARMRKATGDRLFVRLGNSMVPTPYAQGIADPIRQALAGIRVSLGASQEFDPATSQRGFSIFLTDLGEAYFLPRLLERLNRIAPGILLRTLPMPAEAAENALRNGEVDLAIGNLPNLGAGFYVQRLFRDRYVCVLRRDHPAIGERITAKQFAAASHAIVTPGGWGHGIIERTLIAHGLEQRITLRMQNFLVLASIVATTDMVAIVPHSVGSQLSQHNDVKLLPLPIAIPAFDVKQCWQERFHGDQGNRWLRQQFMDLFSG